MVKYLSFFPPVLIASIRMTIAAIVLLPIIAKAGKPKLAGKDWMLIGAVAVTSITLHQIFLAWGASYTTAGTTSLILGLNPLATALLALPFLGERLTKVKLLGILLGFGGVLLVVMTQHNGGVALNGWGDFLVFVAMLMYVVGGILVRIVVNRGIPVLVVTAYSHVIASVLLWLTSFAIFPIEVFASIDVRPFTWLVILTSSVLATGLGALGWNYGIGQLGAARTSMFLNGMPFASLVFAAFLLDEQLHFFHVLALVFIIAGVYLGTKAAKKAVKGEEQTLSAG